LAEFGFVVVISDAFDVFGLLLQLPKNKISVLKKNKFEKRVFIQVKN